MKKKWMEGIAVAAVMNYCLGLFLRYTTFNFTFTEEYRRVTWIALVCIGIARLAFGLWGEIRKAETGKEKGRVILKGVLALGSLIPCGMLAKRFGYDFFPYIPYIAFCIYGMKPEKILRIYAIIIGTALAVTVLCALSGAIRNYLYPGYVRKGQIRAAYGGIYPTDFASHVLYLFLFAWCIQKRRGKGNTALFFCLAAGMAYMLYTYPRSETSTICSIMTAAVVLYSGWMENRRKNGESRLIAFTDGAAIWAFPILLACMWGLVALYGSGSEAGAQINKIMSDRLNLVWTAFNKYGIQAFGTWTPQKGWGNSLIHTEAYEFLDSTYALLPIRYGWVMTILAGSLWVWMTRKAIRTGHRRIGYAMGIIALHSFMEHHFPEMNYNILLAMPLCAFAGSAEGARETVGEKEKRFRLIAVVVGIAAAVTLVLPRTLSWARCLIRAEGWTSGWDKSLAWTGERGGSLNAMLFWLGCLVLATAGCLCLRGIRKEWRETETQCRYKTAGLIITLCLAAAMVIGVNEKIMTAVAANDEQMEAERPAIETVLQNADEPVYAGQEEELYKRKFGGISDRIVSAEEIARNGKGSALLEHDNEGYVLIFTGALYTELSPQTGLFTYDRTLAEKMSGEGYTFRNYYSAAREINLEEAAEEAGLNTEEGEVILCRGNEHIENVTGLDQFGGKYEVMFEVELRDIEAEDDANHEICSIKVYDEGETEAKDERTLYEEEFAGDGSASVTITYSTEDTRGMKYQITGRDGIEIRVKRIAYRRSEP